MLDQTATASSSSVAFLKACLVSLLQPRKADLPTDTSMAMATAREEALRLTSCFARSRSLFLIATGSLWKEMWLGTDPDFAIASTVSFLFLSEIGYVSFLS